MKPVGAARLALALALLLVAAVLVGIFVGPASLAPGEVLAALAGRGGPGEAIVWALRVPRVVLGLLVGGVLAVSGASLQVLVDEKYLRKIPVDPITGRPDWVEVREEPSVDDLLEPGFQAGITEVHSASELKGMDGTAYNTW